MVARRKTIGFDRKIDLAWLNATADWAAKRLPPEEIRWRLEELLADRVAGDGPHSARGKTMTVLLHVWVLVPDHLVPLRNDGIALLQQRSGQGRLPLHWGMCAATYPFFRDVAATTGRLLALQGTATLSQITRRLTEIWGERSTVIRAVQRVMRSMVEWGTLQETSDRGVFRGQSRIAVPARDPVGLWMLGATLGASERSSRLLGSLATDTSLFPFNLNVSAQEVREHPIFETHPQGSGDDLVTLRASR